MESEIEGECSIFTALKKAVVFIMGIFLLVSAIPVIASVTGVVTAITSIIVMVAGYSLHD